MQMLELPYKEHRYHSPETVRKVFSTQRSPMLPDYFHLPARHQMMFKIAGWYRQYLIPPLKGIRKLACYMNMQRVVFLPTALWTRRPLHLMFLQRKLTSRPLRTFLIQRFGDIW